MILQASLIGSWEKLELWGHTHLALFAVLITVCILEVILLNMTTSADLFTRLRYYDESGEYEEDIYFEDISTNYDLWIGRRRTRYRHRPQEQQQLMQQQPNQTLYNIYHYVSDENEHFINNNYHSTSTEVFRFVY